MFGPVTINESPKQWWSKDHSVDPLPLAKLEKQIPAARFAPAAAPPTPTLNETLTLHARIATLLVHELQITDAQAGTTATRLIQEVFKT